MRVGLKWKWEKGLLLHTGKGVGLKTPPVQHSKGRRIAGDSSCTSCAIAKCTEERKRQRVLCLQILYVEDVPACVRVSL